MKDSHTDPQSFPYRIIRANGEHETGTMEVKRVDDEPIETSIWRAVHILGYQTRVIDLQSMREVVRVFWEGKYRTMIVDEEGHRQRLPPNALATVMYWENVRQHDKALYKPATHTIVGDVILFEEELPR